MIAREVVRPLAKGFHDTRDVWGDYSSEQQRAIIEANTVTLGRFAARMIVEAAHSRGKLSRAQFVVLESLLDLGDKIDGEIIRSAGAENAFGKVIDPFVDKLDFFMQELLRLLRGELDGATFLLRLGRDVASTYLRTLQTEHGGDGAAQWWGKLSTAVRSVSLRVGDAYPESKEARWAKHTATGMLLGSLAVSLYTYRKTTRHRA